MKLYVIVLLSFFSFSFLSIDNSEKQKIKDDPSRGLITVTFKKNSYKLSDSKKRDLDSLIMILNENQMAIRILQLQPMTCKAEYKKDMFIGVKRAKVISSYLSSRWQLESDIFHIVEDSYYEESCYTVGVNLFFIFKSK